MPESPGLQQRLEELLLGGPRKYTRLEVARRAGVPEERSRRLWRALGFATAGDDEVVFTDADVEAMRTADNLVQSGLVAGNLEVAVTRALGQHLSRLAEWQVHLLWSLITEHPDLARTDRQVTRLVERLLPELEQVQSFVWRRHLAAYAGRAFAADDDLEARPQVVGFVDMVGYTKMTRRVDEDELSTVLDAFESLAAGVIADHRGRIVKMIGDEVFYVTDSPASGAEIALTLAERAAESDTLPAVRGGLAFGQVLSRFGDVYGSVVNLAARLTSVARPGTVLIDRALAAELAEEPAFELRTRRPVAVRGYNRLRPSALRRAKDRPAGMFAASQERAAEMMGLPDTTRAASEPDTPDDRTVGRRGRRRR
ncbi:adenylate/guanylate cyclase domain-containing protein [Amycolatopsis sp. FDAARGOS 1241]|uniref:adenylate/guanylate cyclase domain-containing protein n=1 Tax=Amycolatopsis sp. FDAARGOS 1241 TaxID=2778070 RepID=UPI0019520180|nr:adenylate/guanylate cyclase domain-containing protein [Amycolatopsis sp. FDAARGOS 1241]QRP44633.1 adenylate/guanylate cyclase domain-containing protein [Amycolatopsis sp. FDAARGOS 1241]